MIANHNLNLWAEAISTACYIKNRLPHSWLDKNLTPYEALQGKKPCINYLQPFGRKCYVHIHKDSRPPGTKLSPRAIEGHFVGYTKSTKIFRIWIPSKNKVVESPNVKFALLNSGKDFDSELNSGKNIESTSFHLNLPPQPSSSTTVESPSSRDTMFSSPLIESSKNYDLPTSSSTQYQSSQPQALQQLHGEKLSINTRPKR